MLHNTKLNFSLKKYYIIMVQKVYFLKNLSVYGLWATRVVIIFHLGFINWKDPRVK